MRTDNTLPSGIHDLLGLGERMAEGLTLHGPFLKITQVPADDFCALLERLRHAEALLSEARAAQSVAGQESTAADRALNWWLVCAKAMLCCVISQKWSVRWVEAGFLTSCRSVPKQMDKRIARARTLSTFLKRNSGLQAPPTALTSDAADIALGRLLEAQKTLRGATVACKTRKRTRDELEKALRRQMRMVVVILSMTIPAHDDRWLAFGLNRPSRAAAKRRGMAPAGEHAEVITLPQQQSPDAEPLREATAA